MPLTHHFHLLHLALPTGAAPVEVVAEFKRPCMVPCQLLLCARPSPTPLGGDAGMQGVDFVVRDMGGDPYLLGRMQCVVGP